MTNENWVQLEESDDWGYHFLRIQDKLIKNRMSNRRDAIAFPHDAARVLWPNGMIQNVKIGWRSGISSVSDHGKQYNVNWSIPVILAEINGVEAKIEIRLVKIHRSCFVFVNDWPRPDPGPSTIIDPSDFSQKTVTIKKDDQ